MAPKLYVAEASPPVRSVLITSAAIGLELEKQEVDIPKGENLTPEYLEVTLTSLSFNIRCMLSMCNK